eukprot:5851026-Pyramimonas_sp.AAC.1
MVSMRGQLAPEPPCFSKRQQEFGRTAEAMGRRRARFSRIPRCARETRPEQLRREQHRLA